MCTSTFLLAFHIKIRPDEHGLQNRSPLGQGYLLPECIEIAKQGYYHPRLGLRRWLKASDYH